MEEFGDEDDFGDLYADVEVQASSAINAMHDLKEMPPSDGVVPGEGIAAKNESKLKCVGLDVVASSKRNCPAGALGEDNSHHCLMDLDKGPFIQSRSSRRSLAQSPVSPDPDIYGCVQISDSEDDSIHEDSDYDADGIVEASNTIKKVNIGSIPHKVQSVEQTDRSQHYAVSSSCSRPSAAVNDGREKINMHSKKNLLNSATELPKPVALDDQYCNRSKSDGVKPDMRDRRYSGRETHPIRKESMQQKTHLNGKDVSGEFDARGVRGMPQMKIGHMKSRALFSQGFNQTNLPYYLGPGSAFTYFQSHFPYHNFGPAYPANHYWNTYPAFGYQVGLYNGHNMNGGGYIDRKRTKMDSEILQGDWYHHNGSRHVKDAVSFQDTTKVVPQTSSADRGTQFSNKSHSMEFRRRMNEGDLPALGEYNNDSMMEKYRRYGPIAHSDKEQLDHKDDYDIPCDKRGLKSLERRKRGRDDPLYSFDSLCQLENEENERKYIKHQSLHINPYKESTVPSREPFHGAPGPKSSTSETYLRSSHEEIHRESGPRGSIDPIFDTNEVLKYHQGEDHFDKRRHCQKFSYTISSIGTVKNHGDHDDSGSRKHHQLCEVLPENEEGYKSRRFDDKMFRSESVKNHRSHNHSGSRNHHQMSEILRGNEEEYKSRHLDDKIFRNGMPSYQFERISRDTRTDDKVRHEVFSDFIDGREADKHFHIMKRKCDSSDQFDLNPRFVDLDSHFPRHLRYQDSINPRLVCDKKSILQSCKRASKVGDEVYHNNQNCEELNGFNLEKVVPDYERKPATKQWGRNMNDMLSQEQKDEFLDIEEGEIIAEDFNEKDTGFMVAHVDEKQSNCVEHPEAAPNMSRAVERFDEQRIQEIRAKMEKRRERFREPITLKKNHEKIAMHAPDLVAETTEGKMERPARKRRWIGS